MQKALLQDSSPFKLGYYRSHPWGTPDQAIRRATDLVNAFGADEIMFRFKYGSMPIAAAEKSIRLFAKEVLPASKELNPAPIRVNGDASAAEEIKQQAAKQ